MVADGFYINDVAYDEIYDWEYTVSISQFNDSFKALLGNDSGLVAASLSHFDDIKIYNNSALVFRGQAHNINPTMSDNYGSVGIVSGYGYMKQLMDQFVIEAYTSKSRSFMVEDMVDTYSNDITTTGNITTTSESLDRVIKARSAYEAVYDLADEIDYDIWIDNTLDFYFGERAITNSGISIDYDTDSISSVDAPKQSTTMYNAVRVIGNGTGILAYVENAASIAQYGVRKEHPPVYDKSLTTVGECEDRGNSIIGNNSIIAPVITIETVGYDSLTPGETVQLYNFDTEFDVDDGLYVLLERSGSYLSGKTILKLAKYSDSTEDVIIDIIKRLRKIEYTDLDADDVPTKFLIQYEELEIEGYTVEVWLEDLGESFILGDYSGNGKLGATGANNNKLGLSGITSTKVVNATRT